jgi:hypothetical protein
MPFENANPESYRAELAALGFYYGAPSMRAGPGELYWRELSGGALAIYELTPCNGGPSTGSMELWPSRAAYVAGEEGAELVSNEERPAQVLVECWPDGGEHELAAGLPEAPEWVENAARELRRLGERLLATLA